VHAIVTASCAVSHRDSLYSRHPPIFFDCACATGAQGTTLAISSLSSIVSKILLLRFGKVPEGVNFDICQMLFSCYFPVSFLSHSWPITEGTSHTATFIAQAMELGGSAKRKNEGGGGIVGGVSKKKAGGDRCISHIYIQQRTSLKLISHCPPPSATIQSCLQTLYQRSWLPPPSPTHATIAVWNLCLRGHLPSAQIENIKLSQGCGDPTD